MPPFPKQILSALEGTDAVATFSAQLSTEQECEGAKFHSPAPLLVRLRTLSNGETVFLCGVCADTLTVLNQLLMQNEGDLPWEVRREFGNRIRAIGLRGYKALKETHGS